ncbi:Retrovirus-related Pol polyprotein from transposon TNT 1-94 [Gossypium australe]|uniref:Retrovirus-related Pol polyprotein from transposon TNT 1-94 n=1 Tax=Gossypium australe TaxID=47621 RepID=A0A5B6X168_9ROSI|nr:Retrovirus-related Pol polyprotein from transposon TNT 1-94 [Gossypium australe]
MEMARCLLFEKDLPKVVWAEAVINLVYFLNLLPTSALVGKTPYEAWHGVKPSIEHFRVFGCDSFSLVTDIKRSKLDKRGTRSLDDVYARMIDEIKMIEKNLSWQLVDWPKNYKMPAMKGLNVYHLDVKSAFLNGLLENEIFVEQPEGFQASENEGNVYKLQKALYGLKQAPRACYSRIDSYLLQEGFIRSESEATLPYIMYVARLLSGFIQALNQTRYGATKGVMRYIKGTFNYGIWYLKNDCCKFKGYANSDWAGSVDDCKCTSGYVFLLEVVPLHGIQRSKMWWFISQLKLSMSLLQ